MLALLGGTSAAFAVTEALKLERQTVFAPRFDRAFSPVCDCPTERAHLQLRLRKADRLTAEVVDEEGEVARVLAEGRRYRRGSVTFSWDGRTDEGTAAPDGLYRLRLRLHGQDRTILVPITFHLDTRRPTVRIERARPAELTPDGDGRADRVAIAYRSDEGGQAVLSVRGEGLPETVVVTGRPRAAGQVGVSWRGKLAGQPLPPGSYILALRVRDQAGNLSEPVEVPLRIAGTPG